MVGLSFFWSLIRHAGISNMVSLIGLDAGALENFLVYYAALTVCWGVVAYGLGLWGRWRSRGYSRLCLAMGAVTVCCMVLGLFGVSIPPFWSYCVLALLALTTSFLAVQCVALGSNVARESGRTLLICIFGSTLLNIIETFLLFDVLMLGNQGAILYPLCSSAFLYAAARGTEASRADGAVGAGGLQWTHSRVYVLIGILVLTTLTKALADAAFLGEGLRLVKDLVGILELSFILIVINAAKGVDPPVSVAFYILLGGFLVGTCLASMPTSSAVVNMGIATITTSRVLAEAMVLVFAAGLVAHDDRSLFKGTFLCFVLPEMLACTVGYGMLPLLSAVSGNDAANFFRCVGVLLVAVVSVGVVAASALRELEGLGAGTAADAEKSEELAAETLESIAALTINYGLTGREALIAQYIYQGYSVKRISNQENISINTVQTHSRNLYRKLGVHSRKELIDLVDSGDADRLP